MQPFIPPKMSLYEAQLKRTFNKRLIGGIHRLGKITDIIIVPRNNSGEFVREYYSGNATNDELLEMEKFKTDDYVVWKVITGNDGSITSDIVH